MADAFAPRSMRMPSFQRTCAPKLANANLKPAMISRSYLSSQDAPARRKIVLAALDLFVRDGLCETSIRDIAAKSGFTNPALFRHFAGKEDLARYLFEHCYLELFALVTRAIASGATFTARHRAVIDAYMTALDEDQNAVLYVQENLRHFWPKMPSSTKVFNSR